MDTAAQVAAWVSVLLPSGIQASYRRDGSLDTDALLASARDVYALALLSDPDIPNYALYLAAQAQLPSLGALQGYIETLLGLGGLPSLPQVVESSTLRPDMMASGLTRISTGLVPGRAAAQAAMAQVSSAAGAAAQYVTAAQDSAAAETVSTAAQSLSRGWATARSSLLQLESDHAAAVAADLRGVVAAAVATRVAALAADVVEEADSALLALTADAVLSAVYAAPTAAGLASDTARYTVVSSTACVSAPVRSLRGLTGSILVEPLLAGEAPVELGTQLHADGSDLPTDFWLVFPDSAEVARGSWSGEFIQLDRTIRAPSPARFVVVAYEPGSVLDLSATVRVGTRVAVAGQAYRVVGVDPVVVSPPLPLGTRSPFAAEQVSTATAYLEWDDPPTVGSRWLYNSGWLTVQHVSGTQVFVDADLQPGTVVTLCAAPTYEISYTQIPTAGARVSPWKHTPFLETEPPQEDSEDTFVATVGGGAYLGRSYIFLRGLAALALEASTTQLATYVREAINFRGTDFRSVGTQSLSVVDGRASLAGGAVTDWTALRLDGACYYAGDSVVLPALPDGDYTVTYGTDSVSAAMVEATRLLDQVSQVIAWVEEFSVPDSRALLDAAASLEDIGAANLADALLQGDVAGFLQTPSSAASSKASAAVDAVARLAATLGSEATVQTFPSATALSAEAVIRGLAADSPAALLLGATRRMTAEAGWRAHGDYGLTASRSRALYALTGETLTTTPSSADPTLPWIARTGSLRTRIQAEYAEALQALDALLSEVTE